MSDPFKSIKKIFVEIAGIWGIIDLFNSLQTLADLNKSLSSGLITQNDYNNQIILQFVIYPAIVSILLVSAWNWLKETLHTKKK